MTSDPTVTDLPDGPALLYRTTTGELVPVDRESITDRRERRFLRGCLATATEICDKADEDDKTRAKIAVGFQGGG